MSPRVDDTTSLLFFVFLFFLPPVPPRGTSPTPSRQTCRYEPPLGKRSKKTETLIYHFLSLPQHVPAEPAGAEHAFTATRLSFSLPQPPCPVARCVSCVAIHKGVRSVACEKVPPASAFVVNFSKKNGCLHVYEYSILLLDFYTPQNFDEYPWKYFCKFPIREYTFWFSDQKSVWNYHG